MKATVMKTTLLMATVLSVLVSFGSAQAESKLGLPPVDLRQGQVVQGDLFSVKVVPGAGTTSFYVVGKEAAKIKMDGLRLQLTIDPDGNKKTFSLKRKNDAYVFEQKILTDSQIEIRSDDGKVEQLRLKVQP